MENQLQAQLQRFTAFYEQDKSNMQLCLDCFEIALKLGEFDKAQTFLDSIRAEGVTDPAIDFAFSKLHLARGEYLIAQQVLEHLVNQGIVNLGVIYNLAWASLNLSEFDKAIELIDSVAEQVSQYPAIQLIKVRALHNKQEFALASAVCSEYLAMENSAEGLGLLALVQLDSGDNVAAKSSAEKAIAINPYNHEALVTLSSIALEEQDLEAAYPFINANPKLIQQSGRMALNHGQALMLELRFGEAEQALTCASQLMSQHIGTWHALAWVKIVLNKIDEAKRCFETAMEIDRNFAESHGGLAVVAVMQGQLELANKLTKTALRLDPNSSSGQYAESLLLERSGNPEAARDKIQAILSQTTGANGLPLTHFINKAVTRLKPNDSDPIH